MPPRVSVISIFYNEARFLAEAIDSVLAQDFTDLELILVDDGSNDGSSEIARRYAALHPDRVFYLEHPGHANRGMSAARNLGIARARGELVTLLDGDDRMLPNRVGEQVALLDANEDAGMVCGGYLFWRSWNGGRDEEYFPGHVFDRLSPPPEALLAIYPLGRANNPTDPMFRRDIALRVGGWEEQFPGLYEDIVFHTKLLLETGVIFAYRIWHEYRIHPTSSTGAAKRGEDERQRSRYLDWLCEYLDARPELDSREMRRAIAAARRRMRLPVVYGGIALLRRIARKALDAAKSVGFRSACAV